jgi:hypothetical protein
VGFVVDKGALWQVFSEYFGFPYQFSFHRLLHIHHHLSSEAGTVDKLVADVPSGHSLTPPQETKREPNFIREVFCLNLDRNKGYPGGFPLSFRVNTEIILRKSQLLSSKYFPIL